MKLKSVYQENGIIGVIFAIIHCSLFGHDNNVGQRCIYCHEPKKK